MVYRSSPDSACNLEPSLRLAYILTLRAKKQRASIHRPRSIVFILNTSPQDMGSAKIAKTLRNSGAEIFLITVGNSVSDAKPVKTLTSLPLEEHCMFIKDAAELDGASSLIKNRGLFSMFLLFPLSSF